MQLLPIKCFLFVLAGLVIFTLAGRGAGRFLRLRLNICEEVCIGFLAFFGAAEAFGWFFTAYRLPTLLFSAVILLIAGALIYAGRRSPEEISHSRQNRGRTTWRELFPFPLLPVIAVVIFMIVMTHTSQPRLRSSITK